MFCDALFQRRGTIPPMWQFVTAKGTQHCEPHPTFLPKDLATDAVRSIFDTLDVVRCLYIAEAWMVTAATEATIALARSQKLHQHPDKIEVVQFSGEDAEGGLIMAQRKIIRGENKPMLAPLEIVIQPGDGFSSEGRFVGMLPQRGTRQ